MLRGKAEKEKGDEAWEGDTKGLERVKVEAKKKGERRMKGKSGRTEEKRGRGESRKEKTGSLGVSERRWTQGESWWPRGEEQGQG